MMDPQTQAPTRLLDDPSLGAQLRQDLELASSHSPAFDLQAGLARFEAAAAAGASTVPAGGTAPTGGALGLRVLGWFLGASVLVGGGLGASQMLNQAREDRVVVQTPTKLTDGPRDKQVRAKDDTVVDPSSLGAAASPSGAAIGESVVEAQVGGEAGDAGTAPAQVGGNSPASDTSAPPRPTSKLNPDPGTSPGSNPGSLADEAKQINAARQALSHDPAKALALAEAAKQAFPEGAMIQEREGYAILALAALGREQDARTRAQSYLQHWPNGTLARRVRDATDQPTVSK